jgi:quercetin dioxygenase-like cupin family protein
MGSYTLISQKGASEERKKNMITATPTSPLWFLDTAVRIRVSADEGRNGLSMLESLAPQGDSPPLHVHTREDELFHVLSGELLLEVGGEELVLAEGETALAPAGVAHTYRVESAEARWLVVTAGGEFERFVRELSRPQTQTACRRGQARRRPSRPSTSLRSARRMGSRSSARRCRRRDLDWGR